MAFSFTDLLEKLGASSTQGQQDELVGEEAASLRPATLEEMLLLFPEEKLVKDGSVAYLPVKMCHSLGRSPQGKLAGRNKRGRGFLPKVIARSAETARDSLVNYDHNLSHNGNGTEDMVLGHIRTARFDPEKLLSREMAAESPGKIPSISAPLYALTALFLRHSLVPGILKDHLSGKAWMTSMECSHHWNEACFLYENELIPIQDAESGMRECVELNRVRNYQDKLLTVCLGGETGSVNYWGLGMTQQPADEGAEVLSILTASPMELARNGSGESRKKIFMPLRLEKFFSNTKDAECAHATVDSKLKEIASISVLGKTSAHEQDGHAHDILTDGTMLPAQGHLHSIANWSLVKGTVPRFTGRTDVHHQYPEPMMGEGGVVAMPPSGAPKIHMHTFDIPLRGKKSAKENANNDSEMDSFLDSVTPEGYMELKKLLASLDSLSERLSSGNSGGAGGAGAAGAADNKGLAAEVASIRKELHEGALKEMIDDAVKKEIANEVTVGNLIPKAKVEEIKTAAVTAAVTEEQTKNAAENKKKELQAGRLKAIEELGIDMESKPYEDNADLTVKKRLEEIALDESGEKEWKTEFRFLKALAAAALAREDAEKAKKETDEQAQLRKDQEAEARKQELLQGQGQSAANAGTNSSGGKKKLIIGAPGKKADEEEGREAASSTTTTTTPKVGKFAFSK